ncbi:MAG: right-handed parallel beta-helix repeat-containing protein, partial [bacterium]|nr:right-handed parallel beta-helix repeat-containing protein [bacterium]
MKKTLELLVGILLIFCFGCNVDPGDGPVGPGPGEDPVYQYYVSPLGDDANSGSREKPWLTIAHGITNLRSGDTLNIRSGTYREELYFNHTGTESRIITIKGESFLNTFIEGASADRDVLFIENSRYVDISQLTIRNAPRTGIRLSYSHDVAIHNCLIADSGKWGVFTDFSDNTALTYCEIYGSREEHGVYISNSSDNAVIGNNIVHHNYASGIQVNADPSMGGDGISSDCLIENNIVFENGIGGGAAINLASVRDCILRNNIIYNNYAGGIAAWDDDQGTQWGCTDLDIFHNSLYFRPGEGRWAISLKNGCTGAEVFNNAVCSGAAGCFQFTDD